jgi:hypothetical protein
VSGSGHITDTPSASSIEFGRDRSGSGPVLHLESDPRVDLGAVVCDLTSALTCLRRPLGFAASSIAGSVGSARTGNHTNTA